MKYLALVFIGSIILVSCKPCTECKYETQKETKVEKFCSSIPEDVIAFEAEQDSLAKAAGSQVFCTKVDY